MKFYITSFILALSFFVNGQSEKAQLNIDSLELAISRIYASDLKDSEQQATQLPDIKAEYWDNKKFNPYDDEVVKFPVKLTFDDTTYASPMNRDKVITSRYGWRRGRAHKGIDIDLITGDNLYSMFDGVVRFVRYHSGHGKTVVVRHFNGLETVYAHLSRYGVKENDTIKKGQYIGKGGATGNARGSHLHLEINYHGVSIHPEYLFSFKEENTVKSKEIWVTNKWVRPYIHNSRRKSKFELIVTEEEALASLIKKQSIYIVKRGDTLSRISSRNNVTISALCKTNSISRNSVIRIGQKLIIEN